MQVRLGVAVAILLPHALTGGRARAWGSACGALWNAFRVVLKRG